MDGDAVANARDPGVGKDADRVAELCGKIERLERQVARLEAENQRLKEENRRLRNDLQRATARLKKHEPPPPPATEAPTPKDYSLESEEKRRARRRRRKIEKRGRKELGDKIDRVTEWEHVYPEGADPKKCKLVRIRVAWRIRQGKGVFVGYYVYRDTARRVGRIPGVVGRGEYGVECLVLVAFLTYTMGVSLDKACSLLTFFCGIPLRKSQADSLLNQLARFWQAEFDALCELIALAMVVHMDETSWPIGKENTSLWAFLALEQAVFIFGCRKDEATLDKILPPNVFVGTAISDDAAVYRERFQSGQKCWAHLLRKIIKLSLLYPEKPAYQTLLNDLLAIYRKGRRYQQDRRLSAAGRARKVEELNAQLWLACEKHQSIWESPNPKRPDEKDFSKLVYELFRLENEDELFTFVRNPAVAATNNESERQLRQPALERKCGRTSKSASGAKRRSVITSVLESLRKSLPTFTLASVIHEISGWIERGASRFRQKLEEVKSKLKDSPQPAMATAAAHPRK